jgi:hypothetical protein
MLPLTARFALITMVPAPNADDAVKVFVPSPPSVVVVFVHVPSFTTLPLIVVASDPVVLFLITPLFVTSPEIVNVTEAPAVFCNVAVERTVSVLQARAEGISTVCPEEITTKSPDPGTPDGDHVAMLVHDPLAAE